ncbi:lipid II flippase Amj family protein [Desulfosporosinus sp. SB140]|uniref:lipid II flippase Amj family protein n=1 Tax=Desulfosporosinus paludis TaxID=3115649 RepID=UPI00389066D8
MNIQIIVVIMLNFIISLIGTLAYSVRLVGVRTGKIAVSFALFNILMLVSRVAVTFQVPILTKYVEGNPGAGDLLTIFNVIIVISGVATAFGALLIPTFQRILYRGVRSFTIDRSLSKLILHSFSKSGIRYMKECVSVPSKENVKQLTQKKYPKRIFVYNLITVALITVGSLAPIYAGILEPGLRATCITLSSIVNGIATILMTIFIDPQLSIMTDDVIDGKRTEEEFRVCVIGLVGSKTMGTFASLLLLLPFSYLIVFIAKVI